jgi:hypothetical protein
MNNDFNKHAWAKHCAIHPEEWEKVPDKEYTAKQKGFASLDELLKLIASYATQQTAASETTPRASGPETKKSVTVNVYPYWSWDGTLYQAFAERCAANNHIPRKYYVESLKTVVGAICGHRMQLVDEHDDARFYTVLLSDVGQSGKSTVFKWISQMFEGTCLLNNGMALPLDAATHNIGCWYGGFGSGVGMIKQFSESARVLQVYDEITAMVEKFTVKGSGQQFLGIINTLYESNKPPTNVTKDTKVKEPPPAAVWNSILGFSIKAKWEEAFGATNADNSGFFQRLNVVYAEKIKLKARLRDPRLNDIRDALMKKITPLNESIVFVTIDEQADKRLDDWYGAFIAAHRDFASDVTGRINTYVKRNAVQIAWLLSDSTTEARITDDVMKRAIALGEWQWRERLLCQPAEGRNEVARMENKIKALFKKVSSISRSDAYLKTHAARVGLDVFDRAIENLRREGFIDVRTASVRKTNRKSDVLDWKGE